MSFAEPRGAREDVATLASHIRVRVLNCSAAGCLLETTAMVAVGAYGKLRVSFEGRDFDDTIQIVRCDLIKGTNAIYHVGTKFISTTPPYVGSLRYTMRQGVADLAWWLDMKADQ